MKHVSHLVCIKLGERSVGKCGQGNVRTCVIKPLSHIVCLGQGDGSVG